MKPEALLLLAFIIGILSVWSIMLFLDFVIDEEKKSKGRFFKVIIKIGLFREKSPPVIILILMTIASIIGLSWSFITLLNILTTTSVIIISIITIIIMAAFLFISQKFKSS